MAIPNNAHALQSPTPGVGSNLADAISRVRSIAERLDHLADRVGGPKPQAVAQDAGETVPASLSAQVSELHRLITRAEEYLGRIEQEL